MNECAKCAVKKEGHCCFDAKEGPLVARARTSETHVSTEKEQKVDDLLAPHFPAAAKAWVDGLEATKTAWNQQSHQFEDTGLPDHKVRAECAEKIWHNVVGRPIERSMQVTGNYKELSELIDELRSSAGGAAVTESRLLRSTSVWTIYRRR